MIILADETHCTACTACSNICPHQAISFKQNEEGFFFPIINSERCIECRLCTKVCPQLNTVSFINNQCKTQCFAAYSYAYQKNGSSGGMFSAIADYVLKEKGIVWGASFDENLQLRHVAVHKEEDMQPLRGSKYLQSDLGNTFHKVRESLNNGKLVLFSGTPCQVAGLNSYLRNRRYPNLITIDVVCHGVPSQKTFDYWMQQVQLKEGFVCGFQFRKLDGWSIIPRMLTNKKKKVVLRYDSEVYMWAFYEGLLFRECCYQCKYANLNRPSDITLADFWGIGNYGRKFIPSQTHGISLVLANSNQGNDLINALSINSYIEQRELDEALHEQHNLKEPSKRPIGRDMSVKDFTSGMSLLDFAKKYKLLPPNKYRYLINSKLKDLLIDFGVFDLIKEISNKIKR